MMTTCLLIVIAVLSCISLLGLSSAIGRTLGVVWAFCAAGIFWLSLPVLSASFAGLGVFAFFVLLPYSIMILADEDRKSVVIPVLHGILLIVLVIAGISSSALFRAGDYQRLLGEVKTGAFATDVSLLDPTQVRLVDNDVAHRRAEELLGAKAGLGSMYEIGGLDLQPIDGKLYYVAPLEHRTFLSWYSNKTSPGYIKISATDLRDSSIVLNQHYRVLTTGCFGDSLERVVYAARPGLGSTDYTFLLDPTGKGMWVVTMYDHKVGLSGDDAVGTMIVDPETGTTTEYSIKDTPQWASRIQPESFVESQVANWGEYVHGYWNFAKLDQTKPTGGIQLVYGNNGRSMWYIGIQSMGSDQGTTGFMLIDTRTKAANYYRLTTGVSEEGARDAMEGKVQNFHYSASWPVLYNFNNVPTYIAILKDAAKNFKMVAVMSVENRSIVVAADDLESALRLYSQALHSGKNAGIDASASLKTYTGLVTRFGSDATTNGAVYYLTLDSAPKVIFTGTSGGKPQLPITRPGDEVTIGAEDNHETTIDIVSFDNSNLPLRRSGAQEKVEQAQAAAVSKQAEKTDESNLDIKISNLTPEQKRALLDKLPKQ